MPETTTTPGAPAPEDPPRLRLEPPHLQFEPQGAGRRRAATALASVLALGAGAVAGPAVATADDPASTVTSPAATTPVVTDTTATTAAAQTTSTTTSTTTTSPLPTDPAPADPTPTVTLPAGATGTTPVATIPQGTATPQATTSATTTTPTTTTAAVTTPVRDAPTPGGTTTSGTTTTVTATKTVPHPKGKSRRPGRGSSRTGSRRGHPRVRHHHRSRPKAHAPLPRRSVKAKSHNRPKPAPVQQAPPSTFTPLGGGSTPGGWGAGVMWSPFTSAQLARYAALVGGLTRPPKYLVKIYRAAGRHYHLPWQVLAAINYVETGYGRDLRLSPAGAEGWMQFMPSTWAMYGVNVGADNKPAAGVPDPWQPRDAIFSAARYLDASGARHNLPRAIFAYNHAGWYVQEVLSIAEQITTRGLHVNGKAKRKIAAMRTTARLLNGMPYVWGGGHATWGVSDGYDCSGFVSAVLHAAGYLKVPASTQTLPDDPAIKPGPGRYVTIFDRTDGGSLSADHVIIEIDGQWWESGGGWLDGAPRVHRFRRMAPGYLQSFNLVLHPRGL